MKRVLIGIGIAGLLSGSALLIQRPRPQETPSPLVVQFAYPVTSIDPSAYDDWESVFIGNHIYRRLLPEDDKPWISYVTKKLEITCAKPLGAILGDCYSVRLSFKVLPFSDCEGRRYDATDVRAELAQVLSAKAWILPGWEACGGKQDEVCILSKNFPDTERRLRNVYFRFGWRKSTPSDRTFGSGTYCLRKKMGTDKTITAGDLVPLDGKQRLPSTSFHVSQKSTDSFHVALYGSTHLLAGTRRNIHAHTPLAYYVVSNPSLADYRLPWNTLATRETVNLHLVKNEVFFADTPHYVRLAPEGNALTSEATKSSLGKSLEFVIPDFLPQCPVLAAALNKQWKDQSPSIEAVCRDIVTYVVENVRGRKKPWAGFLVGVSPSAPGRDSIRNQYFSPESPESWTYDYPKPENLFYLVGMGQSLVTVDSKRVCDIKPNPLGLGDLSVSDFLPCQAD